MTQVNSMNEDQASIAAIREGIDACRPGHDDLRSADLAETARAVMEDAVAARYFERAQRCDARMQAAVLDVAVPEGLAGKLLARLQTTQLGAVDAAAAVALPAASTTSPLPTESLRPRLRKLAWSMALAASLLLATSLIAVWAWRPTGPVDVVTLADVWQEQLSGQWRPMSESPKSLSIPNSLAVAPRGWQKMAPHLGYKAVAYDVSLPHARAILFVVSVSPDGKLPKSPPRLPQSSSGGRAVAVWLAGKQMCMLVVEGDERAYRTIIGIGQVPLA